MEVWGLRFRVYGSNRKPRTGDREPRLSALASWREDLRKLAVVQRPFATEVAESTEVWKRRLSLRTLWALWLERDSSLRSE
jgi:hypothetical protein